MSFMAGKIKPFLHPVFPYQLRHARPNGSTVIDPDPACVDMTGQPVNPVVVKYYVLEISPYALSACRAKAEGRWNGLNLSWGRVA